MKRIIPAIRSMTGICGEQKIQPGPDFRLSRHCLAVPCLEGTLLYHVMTGETVLLEHEETEAENREELTRTWFLVPRDFDERKHADEVRKVVRLTRPLSKEKTDFSVLTTTDCNARCFYCYEMGIRRFSMPRETARETAEYIARVSGGKPVKIRWFGGEPLYNQEAISMICDTLAARGIEYKSSMVSNGYYLDTETVQKARDQWHLEKVQITIDGTEDKYNQIKAYIHAEGNPYQRIMNNIRAALQTGIKVTIRLNMDADNATDLLRLVDEIAERFADSPKPNLYVAILQEFAGKIHEHNTPEDMEQQYYAIRNKAEEYGLLRQKELPHTIQVYSCMADNPECETILPDGRTGRCEHYSEAVITGSIRDEKRDQNVVRLWQERLDVQECEDCVLYPVCVKLKQCEWNRNGCTEASRRIRIEELKKQVLAAYRGKNRGGEEH